MTDPTLCCLKIGKKEGVGEFLVLSDLEAGNVVLRDGMSVCWSLSVLSVARVMSVCISEPVGVEAWGR